MSETSPPLDGVVETIGPNGGPAERATFRQGVLHGPLQQFRPDGGLAREMHFAEGKLQGAFIDYDSAGRVAAYEFGPELV